ncbi:hypothetical protein SNE40_003119 [Patella caerulea]|uniref:Biotin-protein ligase N-terminal domain-containing protein n=1 Tax=Patella caerulea TaxID=87958 RepID=A0AAN8KHD2_PATCE
MSSKRMVYVYDGKGAEENSKKLLIYCLQQSLDKEYDVCTISPDQIKEGSWKDKAAAIAFGGGYDLGFISDLGSQGINNIKLYVKGGGKYLGICAGAYFGCKRIEFDKCGPLEVCGDRDLGFFPGLCKGPVYPGFKYNTFEGSLAVPIQLQKSLISQRSLDVFFHGGGYFETNNIDYSVRDSVQISLNTKLKRKSLKRRKKFLNTSKKSSQQIVTLKGEAHLKLLSRKVEILANYSEIENKPPAIVTCYFGKGVAILSGVHIEYSSKLLDDKDPFLKNVIEKLQPCEDARSTYFMSLLEKLGLNIRLS